MQKQKNIYFYVLIRHWRSFTYFDRCINSVLSQNYKNFKILFVDDNSGYDDFRKIYIREKLKGHIIVFNKTRKYSIRNGYELINKYAIKNNAVVINLDADDWLISNNVFKYLNIYYLKHPDVYLTYGECVLWDGNKYSRPARKIDKYWNHQYPNKIIKYKLFRKYPFLPLHPRTWKVSLFKKIKKASLFRPDRTWLKFAEDQAYYYPMLEMVGRNFGVINKPLYVYNIFTEMADIKVNTDELLKDELLIRTSNKYAHL
jgi:glycosyltransferase involved in cell wall biosynthesis